MYILDTNVVSELRKAKLGRANENVVRWANSVEPSSLFISVISLHELEVGVRLLERRDSLQGRIFRAWLDGQVIPAFPDRVLTIDAAVALRSAQLNVPDARPIHDGFIAATALVHSMTVVTRNTADFAGTGVLLLNPWGTF